MCHAHKYEIAHTLFTHHVPGYGNAVANRDKNVRTLDCNKVDNNNIVWFVFKRQTGLYSCIVYRWTIY